MKKGILLLMLLLLVPALAFGETAPEQKTMLLITDYCQTGWGESFTLGAVDDKGNLWTLSLESWQGIPLSGEPFLQWVESEAALEMAGTLSASDLFDLKGMVAAVQAQEVTYTTSACDAGSQRSYACRRGGDGQTELVLLGASGDDMFENTDPTAQALYRFLRDTFPKVTAYDGESGMAPAGFQAVDLLTFCGCEGLDFTNLTLTAFYTDCETGPSETEPGLTAEEILQMMVTGKKNCNSVTGNTVTYRFTDKEGKAAASFTFCDGLLVTDDGMYKISTK